MRYRSSDIVDRALAVLDSHGLADLTMRRLAADLGLQPSALYHHFANKQTLLAAVADELLARGRRSPRSGAWDERVVAVCVELRDAMLAYRDGADVVATVHAFGLGATAPYDELVAALRDGGLDPGLAPTAARTLLHFVFGHTGEEQQHLQAAVAGAIDADPRDHSDFELGLGLVMDGIRLNRESRTG